MSEIIELGLKRLSGDFPLKFTDVAIEKLADALVAEEPGSFIRVSLVGGGCAGFSRRLDVENEFDQEEDFETYAGQTRVVVDCMSAIYLADTTLDFVTKDFEEGFSFLSPETGPGSIKKTCACGASVSY